MRFVAFRFIREIRIRYYSLVLSRAPTLIDVTRGHAIVWNFVIISINMFCVYTRTLITPCSSGGAHTCAPCCFVVLHSKIILCTIQFTGRSFIGRLQSIRSQLNRRFKNSTLNIHTTICFTFVDYIPNIITGCCWKMTQGSLVFFFFRCFLLDIPPGFLKILRNL